jgi:hypothetical protein
VLESGEKMANLRKRIQKLEENLGVETITLRFADGRTETIKCNRDYVETLCCLLVESTDGNPPPRATPLQAKHFKWLCECESYEETGGRLLELGLAIMRSPNVPDNEMDPADIPVPAPG